jgi:hypothetical protein
MFESFCFSVSPAKRVVISFHSETLRPLRLCVKNLMLAFAVFSVVRG